ncbi:MAG TPA: right-handed parallel beta-helix repeat-containing protein [Chitinispirillaceae bacterium]|nr:right-handed parallel beta-helix repeat-containing protein [Chitinispirillaceae bacterium]
MKKQQFFMTILLLVLFSSAEKRVGGIISNNINWNEEDGPYIIEKDLLIAKSTLLTINPGTRILIRNHPLPDTTVYQLDKIDSSTISIKVEGTLICLGRKDQHTYFTPVDFLEDKYSWYGIVFKSGNENVSELTNADITGAYRGVYTVDCSPLIRSSVLEYNHIGIFCSGQSKAEINNCVIARNFASGILISESNPHLNNNIVVFNRNHGLWCDGISKVYLQYNCFYANYDGNFLECDPEFGILVKTNANKDSIDLHNNIFSDPVFAGSVSDSIATEKDYNLPTFKSKIKDSSIAQIIYEGKTLPEKIFKINQTKYQLSRYSPCIDAGHPGESFKDIDGSRNDMGISGGPEFVSKKSKTKFNQSK